MGGRVVVFKGTPLNRNRAPLGLDIFVSIDVLFCVFPFLFKQLFV